MAPSKPSHPPVSFPTPRDRGVSGVAVAMSDPRLHGLDLPALGRRWRPAEVQDAGPGAGLLEEPEVGSVVDHRRDPAALIVEVTEYQGADRAGGHAGRLQPL